MNKPLKEPLLPQQKSVKKFLKFQSNSQTLKHRTDAKIADTSQPKGPLHCLRRCLAATPVHVALTTVGTCSWDRAEHDGDHEHEH